MRSSWVQLALPVGIVILLAVVLSQAPTLREDVEQHHDGDLTATNSLGIEMVLVPSGRFSMGSKEGGVGAFKNEQPVHQVKIKPFYLSKYEVTQAQWVAVMGNNPSLYKNTNRPVDQVTWFEVQEFIQRLNQIEESTQYRLPSEAEWEYAARAGSDTAYAHGDDTAELHDYAWFGHEGNVGSRPVGGRKPNAWGLYDMHGNVWEWVEDCWHDDYHGAPTDGRPWLGKGDCAERVVRGGAWNSSAEFVRSAVRGSYTFDLNDVGNGFRLAKSP